MKDYNLKSMKYPNKMVPARLGLYTQKIVKPVFKARGLMEGKIITHWHQIVGEKFARLSLAEKVTFPKGKKTEGTLHLNVTSAGSLLLHYAQDLILEQVNTFFGYKALSKLHMSHGLTPSQEVAFKPPSPPLSEEENQWLNAQTQAIEDPELKQCLKNLGEVVLSPPKQRFASLFALLIGGALLSACSNGPEAPEVCTIGSTTPAPKKATSRPYQIKGVWYYPQPHYEYEEVGLASYYGEGDIFHGRPTATGEIFDKNGITGAHKTLPLPCIVEVTNLENGRQIQMKVNDRGPFIEGRIIDLSYRVAQLLGSAQKGVVKVRVRTLVPETLALNGIDPATVMVAQAAPPLSPQPEVLVPERPALVAAVPLPTLPSEIFQEEKPTVLAKASTEPLATGIFVDVGAHPTLEEAKKLSSQVDKLTDSPITPVKNRGAKPYAVRIGPLPSMFQANQMLDQLTRAGHAMARIVIHR
jgi:rare lipoprotein A